MKPLTSIGLVVALCGIVAAWIASGASGLLAHPLRHALTWLAIGAAAVAATTDGREKGVASQLLLLGGLVLAVIMTSSTLVTVNILAVPVFLSACAFTRTGRDRAAILLAAEAVTALGVYHCVRTSIPVVWQAADAVGLLFGRLAGSATHHPLWVGATMGGLDYLVPMTYLAVMAPLRFGCPISMRKPWRSPFLLGLAAVALGHFLYLAGLSFAAPIVASLPEAPLAPSAHLHSPPVTSFADVLRKAVPWNLPVLALLMHTGIAAAMLWLTARLAHPNPSPSPDDAYDADETSTTSGSNRAAWARFLVAGLLATSLVLVLAPSSRVASLKGKKIVFYERGFLNWLRPRHGNYGQYSAGMYGMLPVFLQSYGAQTLISPELSDDDLQDADAIVLLFPNETWQKAQLERILSFVRRGGSLLVMGEHTVREADGGSRFNDVLEPTAMRVRFDSAMYAVGGWLQSYEPLWHPTSTGIKDTENDFGVVIGASVRARPPARPLLVGRWGWADPGDETAGGTLMGNQRYDGGEKLGDLVLAAEQRFGKGKIIVFGDTSSLTNGINVSCHPYTSRLFAYLADRQSLPMPNWRQWFGLLAAAAIVVLLAIEPRPVNFGIVAVAVSVAMSCCSAGSYRANDLVPDGNLRASNKLAYIDRSHLEVYSRESWREDGTMGLCLTLMRNGYLALSLPEMTLERLRRAQMVVSIAPARPFSRTEREAVKQYVRGGGIFLCTVGYDRAGPSRDFLSELGFRVGAESWHGEEPIGEPEPLGHFKVPYFDGGDYEALVRFHAAWPVHCDDPNAWIVAHSLPRKPLIAIRRFGTGRIIVVGDTCFAMNKNLEHASGEPFDGLRENADFWRWLLASLGEGEHWQPPKPGG